MPRNPQLLNALLAMDVYHRIAAGGLAGLVPETQIDETVRGTDKNLGGIGFVAQSYTWNGRTIIADRGTDVSICRKTFAQRFSTVTVIDRSPPLHGRPPRRPSRATNSARHCGPPG